MPGVNSPSRGGVEWFECSIEDVKAAYNSLYEGDTFDRPRDKRFGLRDEQRRAIEMADATSQPVRTRPTVHRDSSGTQKCGLARRSRPIT